jgi:predicted aspartyl protease
MPMTASPLALLAMALAAQPPLPPAPAAIPDIALAAAPDDADPASTAVRLREAGERMTVAVTIDGAGPFRFVVDTGATRTVISDRLAALLALPAIPALHIHSVGGESDVPAVRIAALGLGDMPARAVEAPVLSETHLGAAGILGIDMLADRKVVVDFIARRMSVEPAGRRTRTPAADEIVVTARRRYGQLVVADADAAGQRIWAVVDTGSMTTIGNPVLREMLVRRRRATIETSSVTDVVGNRVPVEFARTRSIRLGRWLIGDPVFAFADAHAFVRFGLERRPSMLLGMDLLRAFAKVSIDFRRQTVRLARRRADQLD